MKDTRPVRDRIAWAARAAELYASGLSQVEVAPRVGKTPQRVSGILKEMGIPIRSQRKVLDPAVKDRIIELAKSDWIMHHIHRETGVSRGLIQRTLDEAGVVVKKAPPPSAERRRNIAADYAAGMRTKDIVAKYQVSAQTVVNCARKAGLKIRPPRRPFY